jgi:hypothetical protein
MTVIYVCTDTRWQSINLVPALAIGPIDRFLFLSARRGGDFHRADIAHAGRPQNQFIEAFDRERARQRVNHLLEPGELLTGPVVGVQHWREGILTALKTAPQGAEVIVNYLSGPSDVKVAAWLALQELASCRSDLRLRCVLYDPPAGNQPSRLEWNEWNGTGWQQRIEPVGHLISLEGWLCLHGFTEADSETRAAREALAMSLSPELDGLATLVFHNPQLPSGWFVEMSGAIKHGIPNNLNGLADSLVLGAEQRALRGAIGDLVTIAAAVKCKMEMHADTQPDTFSGPHDFIEFFRASWFEMLVFLELKKRLPPGSQAQPLFDLPICLAVAEEPAAKCESGSKQDGSVYQLDVGIMANNQFHYVECKAHRAASKKKRPMQNREHLNHLRRIKEDLVGPGGIALLASAVPNDEASATARYAEFGHLEFAAGWPAVCSALDRIVSRCG